ncbi:protein phosphatase 2C domain-containing protein [Paucisalibacillus globulus]|uniref:protein phosphatase 2C domain-containing protein n=1 Tax=Paucisalibacillus globulus TaxID=351095 RepID=UPI00040A5068|nr:protein phosphatase 2C domain-containing protein [Paucisalibacillus globulus]
MENANSEFSWVGSQENFVDNISIQHLNHISIGLFGGNSTAGQFKNEDGCLVWGDRERKWEFAVILDAHNSAESTELVIRQFMKYKETIENLLSCTCAHALKEIQQTILHLFQEKKFLSECRKIKGETACLILLRMGKYVWWFSIGDCISYVFHPELAKLGQYQLNQRQFFEWVGQVNTFDQVVPCYSSGVRELRNGLNRILLTTDGLVECPNEPFSNPIDVYNVMMNHELSHGVKTLLGTIKENNVRDSTTIISWDVTIDKDVTIPSNDPDLLLGGKKS